MFFLIKNIKYLDEDPTLPESLVMKSNENFNKFDLKAIFSDFILEKTGFIHESFKFQTLRLNKGKSYTFSDNKTELVYMGESDDSDIYNFANIDEPEKVEISIKQNDLIYLNSL